ncbi:MAG: ABC transporter ATP-binding protein [Actinomycetota bacterium]|nr:ABC transporter ATP-binding protein [Actinomycetota bacterium]
MRLTAAGVTAVIDGYTIVSSAHIEVGEAEIVGLVGPNGSGKSTLLRCIYRVLRPHAGLIGVDGDDVWKLSARTAARRTAVVVQEPPSDFDFAVRDMVMMGRAPHLGLLERGTETDDRIVDEALARVRATDFADRGFLTLSGGEKQRVLLARALAQQSRLLVLDEPTNHLDILHQLEVLELVRQLGVATLAALHDLNLAAAYCDRIYVLSKGDVVASGRPEDVLTPQLVHDVFGVGAARSVHPVTGKVQLAFHAPPEGHGRS